MCVRVCAYFSSDILMTGESRHKEKSPVSIIRTDSLLSLSESHTESMETDRETIKTLSVKKFQNKI